MDSSPCAQSAIPSSVGPSSSSTSSPTSSADDYVARDFVRVLFLNSDESRVLMIYENDDWQLPYIHYDDGEKLTGRSIFQLCRDMQEYFEVEPDLVQFSVTVELLKTNYVGTKTNLFVYGTLWLVVMECQPEGRPEELRLPEKRQLAWKDLQFFSSCVDQFEDRVFDIKIMQTALKYMQCNSTLHKSISDPRFQRGWFKKAATFLVDTVREDGAEEIEHVIQQQICTTSTILKVKSSRGWYFLKSPAWGSNECAVTAAIAKLFPESSPKLMATNTDLNYFITKGFEHNSPGTKYLHKLVRELGRMQLKSVSCIEDLSNAGCALLDPARLMEKMKSWETNYPFDERGTRTKERLMELIPIAMDSCRKLQDYNIPSTLVHGDFAQSNATYSGAECESVWLFDWQYACISHPFSDFYRLKMYQKMYVDIGEEELNEAVDEYLRMWEPFEDLERAREAYELASMLGWFLKLCAIEQMRASCDYHVSSNWDGMVKHLVDRVFSCWV